MKIRQNRSSLSRLAPGRSLGDNRKKTVRHPCAGRSAIAVAVFETIAIGQDPPLRVSTIKALLKAGLIQKNGERQIGTDMFGPIYVPSYEVPLNVHMQWCQWCAENVPDPRRSRKKTG